MDMRLSPEQLKLRSAARELAEAEFAARAAEIDRTEAYPFDNVAALKAAGFMGYTIPKSYGGRGGSYFEAALIIEEMAQVCGATGRITVEANMGAISAVMQYGTEKQKRLGDHRRRGIKTPSDLRPGIRRAGRGAGDRRLPSA